MVLLLVFYVVPVTLVAVALSETALCDRYSSINNLVKSSFIAGVVKRRPLALVGIMLLLPPLFLGLGVWQGCHSSDAASEIFWCLTAFVGPTRPGIDTTPSRDAIDAGAIDATLRAGGRRTRCCRCRATSFQIINVLLVRRSGSAESIEEISRPASTFPVRWVAAARLRVFCCYVFMKAAELAGTMSRRAAGAPKRLIYPSATAQDRKHASRVERYRRAGFLL